MKTGFSPCRQSPILYFLLLLFTAALITGRQAWCITVTIGTGGTTGVYHPAGKAIAEIVNKHSGEIGFQVDAVATAGSVFNINAMMAGDLEMGIVQSDRQYQAWNGINDWKEMGPRAKLRSICSFHSESVVLVAREKAGINTLEDLKGKRVNIGNPGSGPRGNAIDVLRACGIDWRRELNVESVRAVESPHLLQEGKLDAFFYTVGHPNESILESTTGKHKVHFIPLTGTCIDQLVAKWPYYSKTMIPITHYPKAGNREDVATFGVKATFCTSEDVPERIVYQITKTLFANLEEFKKLHPAFLLLNSENMLEALSAPLHPGALRYFKEAGMKLPPVIPRP